MHAVILTGGKQYRVQVDDIIDIELIEGNDGEKVEFNDVLSVGDGKDVKFGSPTVSGAKVEGEIVNHFRGDKLIAFKFKKRKGYHKTKGHRQNLVKVKISKISA
ncbi:MAG TPA: 50S ribosomal protein L21 [Lentisphaeria bacterium]|nr:MAG: 50S ribosomal protein L21 [Lentisphaerae bacterium GWF2_38_69]HBM15984.1 50S ribosomal protein L21 [Lentisphaeria bacterium]